MMYDPYLQSSQGSGDLYIAGDRGVDFGLRQQRSPDHLARHGSEQEDVQTLEVRHNLQTVLDFRSASTAGRRATPLRTSEGKKKHNFVGEVSVLTIWYMGLIPMFLIEKVLSMKITP